MDATTIKSTETFKKVFPSESHAGKLLATCTALLVTLAHDDISKAQKFLKCQSAILREIQERE